MDAAALYEWALVVLVVAWLTLSLIGQFHHKRVNRWRQHDPFHLIPVWTFFAPNPGRSDYHVLIRDRLADGDLTEWRDALPIPRQRLSCALWNPYKRRVKILTDATGSIVEGYGEGRRLGKSREDLQRSLLLFPPYLLALNMVVNEAAHHREAEACQFAIIERFAFGQDLPPVPILVSPFHRLTQRCQPSSQTR